MGTQIVPRIFLWRRIPCNFPMWLACLSSSEVIHRYFAYCFQVLLKTVQITKTFLITLTGTRPFNNSCVLPHNLISIHPLYITVSAFEELHVGAARTTVNFSRPFEGVPGLPQCYDDSLTAWCVRSCRKHFNSSLNELTFCLLTLPKFNVLNLIYMAASHEVFSLWIGICILLSVSEF